MNSDASTEPVGRHEGYLRSQGKEQAGLEKVMTFFQQHDLEPEIIIGRQENFRHGDLRFPQGTVECKSQPIDPSRYSQNFVEVMEDTTEWSRAHHAEGFERTAELLDMTPAQLEKLRVRGPDRVWSNVGRISHVSPSLTSVAGSLATLYVNPDDGHLYLYSSSKLLWHVRRGVKRGLYRGCGQSNEDTISVFVPIPDARWEHRAGTWRMTGRGDEEKVLAAFRTLVLPASSVCESETK